MFIDIHVHTCNQPAPPRKDTGQAFATPAELLEMYAEVGIDRAVVLPCVNPECNFATQSVQEALDIAAQYPGKFVPFCNLDPRMVSNSPDADLGYLMEYYKERGCPGVGEVCANLYFDDPLVENLFRHAERNEMLLTFHVATQQGGTYGLIDDLHLPRFTKMVEKFPDLRFLCHSQAFWSEIGGDVTDETRGGYPTGPVVEGGKVVELLRNHPNVYGDLSAGSGHNAVSRDPEFGYWFLTEFQDRLCFGTDVCAPRNRNDVLVWLADFLKDALANGKITQEVFDKVAFGNAQRLLGE
jgi:predicted TIM-barrel fold metal-dependent hydrolase